MTSLYNLYKFNDEKNPNLIEKERGNQLTPKTHLKISYFIFKSKFLLTLVEMAIFSKDSINLLREQSLSLVEPFAAVVLSEGQATHTAVVPSTRYVPMAHCTHTPLEDSSYPGLQSSAEFN